MADQPLKKKHHFVPQGYLRGFANEREQVRTVLKDQSRNSYLASVNNVGAENYLYWLKRHPKPDIAEDELSKIEGQCLPHLRELAAKGYVRHPNIRYNLAYYMALQFLRGPDIRDVWAASQAPMFEQSVRELEDHLLTMLAHELGVSADGDRETVTTRIIDREREMETPTFEIGNEHRIGHLFDLAERLIPLIALRRWQIIRLKHRKFITCDRPMIIVDSDGSVLRGGFAESTTLFFPLTRDAAVLMRHVNGVTGKHLTVDMDDRVQAMLWSGLNDWQIPINTRAVDGLNLAIARAAYRDIYCHPDDVKHLPESLRTSFEGE